MYKYGNNKTGHVYAPRTCPARAERSTSNRPRSHGVLASDLRQVKEARSAVTSQYSPTMAMPSGECFSHLSSSSNCSCFFTHTSRSSKPFSYRPLKYVSLASRSSDSPGRAV